MLDRLTPYLREPVTDLEDRLVFLGCSHVWGQGVGADQTLSEVVARKSNLAVANLGVRGGSCSLVAEIIESGILAPARAVIIAWPNLDRSHLWVEEELVCLGHWTYQGQPRPPSYDQRRPEWEQIKAQWIDRMVSGQAELDARRLQLTSWQLRQPCLEFGYADMTKLIDCTDLGSDNLHWGASTQSQVADLVLTWLELQGIYERI